MRQAPRRRDEAEIGKLSAIKAQAEANGVMDLVWLSGDEARALEPALAVHRALLSPSTGIIDSHALMQALRGDAERYGAMVALDTPVLSGRVDDLGIIVETGGASPTRIAARAVINAAGLGSHAFARSIIGMPADRIPPLYLAKGNYFALTTRSPFARLIYPIPTPGGLGVHLTLDLAGQARFGPDVEWVEKIDYNVDLWPSGRVLRRHQSLLARPAGLFIAARLFRDKTKNLPAWRVRNRVPRPIGKRAWGARLDQPVRN